MWDEWIKFRQKVVAEYVQFEVNLIANGGISPDKIYTHQVLPNWEEGRETTGNTWTAAQANKSSVGLSIYHFEDWFNETDFVDAYCRNEGSGWGATEFNPCSNKDYERCYRSLESLHRTGAGFVIPIAWEPYKDYSVTELGSLTIQGTEFERALVDFIRDIKE